MCASLELVLLRLRMVRVDNANKRIRHIRPVISKHGIEYMRSHFTKQVSAVLCLVQGYTYFLQLGTCSVSIMALAYQCYSSHWSNTTLIEIALSPSDTHTQTQLQDGMGLDKTIKWIHSTMGGMAETNDLRLNWDQLIADVDLYYLNVLYVSIVNLVGDFPNWGGEQRDKAHEDELPETMLLDLLRVKVLNLRFHTDMVCFPPSLLYVMQLFRFY